MNAHGAGCSSYAEKRSHSIILIPLHMNSATHQRCPSVVSRYALTMRVSPPLSRRRFLVATAAAIAAPRVLTAQKTEKQLVIGEGEHRYEVLHNWPQLPDKFSWQTTHNVAVDRDSNLYVIHEGLENLKDHPSIFVFDPSGKFVRAFGQQFQGGGHGLEVRTEGKEQFLWVTAYQQVKSFAKLTLQGEPVWLKHAPMDAGGFAPNEDTKPAKRWGRDAFMPTNFAFLPDGGFFLADGYGSYRIHRYDKDGKWLSMFGKPGKGDGEFNTPHGIWIDNRPGRDASVVVADRANARLQWFTLEGKHLKTLNGFILPANLDTLGDVLLVPDLSARITLLGKDDQVLAHLGEDPAWREQVLKDGMKLRGILAKVSTHLVILVEQRDAGAQVGHEEHVAARVDVRGEEETVEGLEMFAREGEPLEAFVRAVGDDDGGFVPRTIINPDAVRGVELAVALAGFAKHGEPLAVGVITMDAVGAVAVGEEEAAVGEEGEVRGHEGVAAPAFLGRGVLVLGIEAGVHRGVLEPDEFALEGELGEVLQLLVAGDVEELLAALGADFQAVAAALELVAEGAHELALGIKDEDGRVAGLVLAALVDDVEEAVAIDGDVVGGLPGVFVGQLGPVVLHLVTVLARADDELGVGLLRGEHAGRGARGERGGGEETTAGEGAGGFHVWGWGE